METWAFSPVCRPRSLLAPYPATPESVRQFQSRTPRARLLSGDDSSEGVCAVALNRKEFALQCRSRAECDVRSRVQPVNAFHDGKRVRSVHLYVPPKSSLTSVGGRSVLSAPRHQSSADTLRCL